MLRVSMGADTKANTRGPGALDVGDLRLFEDGGEGGGALGQDGIVRETARGGWGQCMREQARVNGR